MRDFGFIKGMPHDGCAEEFEDYKKFKNSIPKKKIIEHMESDKVVRCYGLMNSHDIFTGQKIECGLIEDGKFMFPMEFLHYYKNYDIGIPYDYEEYLKGIIDY
ncbi:MAG: hypothetical protein IJ306_07125 [Oscillospiraceae bacterium]|nr:hypothetical protein [Oscillospiraceae bacterium]